MAVGSVMSQSANHIFIGHISDVPLVWHWAYKKAFYVWHL